MTDLLTRLPRRPLWTPTLLPLLVLLAAGVAVFGVSLWARTTVVILVRHAEAAQSDTGDPDLSPAGESRARRLGPFLEDALPGRSVDHLYAADSRRSQQTAASVANQYKLPINLLGSSDWAGLAGRLRRDHRGATVVVVAHSTALQSLAAQLAAGTIAAPENDFGSVFVLVSPSVGQARLVRLRYGDAPPSSRAESRK
jgi:broad specificity phosphatase PhoE